jgi:hypothetical protein
LASEWGSLYDEIFDFSPVSDRVDDFNYFLGVSKRHVIIRVGALLEYREESHDDDDVDDDE